MFLIAFCLHASLAQHSHPVRTQAAASQAEVASVRRFVQNFYDWYTPQLLKGLDAEHLVLKKKESVFSPELRKALWEDWTAQSRVQGSIVGLDFDPFTNSQDPAARYAVRTVERKGRSWLVSVYESPSVKDSVPAVVAKVEAHNRSWRFTNFLYDHGDHLLGILARLKADRKGMTERDRRTLEGKKP